MTQRRAHSGLPDHESARLLHGDDQYRPRGLCLESKSLKLYLASYRNEGVFCEGCVKIRDSNTS